MLPDHGTPTYYTDGTEEDRHFEHVHSEHIPRGHRDDVEIEDVLCAGLGGSCDVQNLDSTTPLVPPHVAANNKDLHQSRYDDSR